jgi:hypothetical protein
MSFARPSNFGRPLVHSLDRRELKRPFDVQRLREEAALLQMLREWRVHLARLRFLTAGTICEITGIQCGLDACSAP